MPTPTTTRPSTRQTSIPERLERERRETVRAPSGYRVRHSNGTYYRGRCGIGPQFGATRAEAMTFATQTAVVMELMTHTFAFAGCQVETPKGDLIP